MHYTKAVLHDVFYDGDVMTQEGDTGMNVLASAGKKNKKGGWMQSAIEKVLYACVYARARVCVLFYL